MADDVIGCGLGLGPQIVDDDQRLVSEAQRDPEAAGRLYDRHYAAVFGYIYHSTLDRAVTEDLTANVFLAAFRHLGRFRWQKVPLRAWLYRIATNEIRMHYRRRRYARAADVQARHAGAEGSAPSADQSPAAAEEFRLLHQALAELRWKDRSVIILRYFEDKTLAEIAAITKSREGTIKSRLHRGLAHLQEILTRRGVLRDQQG